MNKPAKEKRIMQMADITLVYTEEEKEAFKEELDSRNRMEDKENNLILLEREWNSHVMGNHTDIYSPIGFTLLGIFIWLVTVYFVLHGFSFWAIVTALPVFGTAALVVGIVFWVRYGRQLINYRNKEKELDEMRKKTFLEYQKLKEEHAEKLKTVEAIVYSKSIEKRENEEEYLNRHSFEDLFKKE